MLRIDVPGPIGRRLLIPNLMEFRARHPDVQLVICMTDRRVDLVSEAVDCALRVGSMRDSSLVARRLGVFAAMTSAFPDHLRSHGAPKSLDDLAHHVAVNYFSSTTGRTTDFDFVVDGRTRHQVLPSAVAVNDGDAYVGCALQGFGLIQTPRYMVRDNLLSGALLEVLPESPPEAMPLSIVYLRSRQETPKLRAFIDWSVELFGKLAGEE